MKTRRIPQLRFLLIMIQMFFLGLIIFTLKKISGSREESEVACFFVFSLFKKIFEMLWGKSSKLWDVVFYQNSRHSCAI